MEKPCADHLFADPPPSSPSPRRLGLFAKQPLPGRVKTRLSPPLAANEAAELYRVCLAESVQRLAGGPWGLTLFHAGGGGYFAAHWPHLSRHPQQGEDLGARMTAALELLLAEGPGTAALVGSDSPDLPLALVESAFVALEEGADAVVVPARDGGYVLVGVRRPCPGLFREIPWSTAVVRVETRRRAADLGLRLEEIGGWEDIDDLAGLARLVTRSPQSLTARHARQALAPYLPSPPES